MKVNFEKVIGGHLIPLSDLDAEKMKKIKTGSAFELNIPNQRSPKFHRRVFKFFEFCFEHWSGDREFMDESGQFDVFRKDLTVLAGYYDTYYSLSGEARVEAKSISYSNMEQEEFEQLYNALIRVAVQNIFVGCDELIENRLMGFF